MSKIPITKNKDKRVFFIGITEIGLACFNKLIEMGVNIVGCVHTNDTLTIKKTGNIKNATYVNFKEIVETHGIDCVFYDKSKPSSNAELEQSIKALSPDLILVSGWHYILKNELLDIPPLGVLGLHPSLLPLYRGGAPLTWQIINDEKEAGVSLFYLEDGVDIGDIVGQESFPLSETDTIKEALLKSKNACLQLIENLIPQVLNGTAPRLKQDDSKATYVPQRVPSDGLINWEEMDVRYIYNFVRAQTRPYPGAFGDIDGVPYKIWGCKVFDTQKTYPDKKYGTCVEKANDDMIVNCRGGLLLIDDYELESIN